MAVRACRARVEGTTSPIRRRAVRYTKSAHHPVRDVAGDGHVPSDSPSQDASYRLNYRLHNRWFPLSVEHFNVVHHLGISIYKIGVLLFNLVPYFVLLYLIGHDS